VNDKVEVDSFSNSEFSERETYFAPTELRRAFRYVEESKRWVKRMGGDGEDDSGAVPYGPQPSNRRLCAL
jgi:hypothetical protein